MPVETLFKQKTDYRKKIKISFKENYYAHVANSFLNILNMLEEDKLFKLENKSHVERLLYKHNLIKTILLDETKRL